MPFVKNPVLRKLRKEAADTRRAYVLKEYRAGKSVDEIAEEIGRHRSTVYLILTKGKAK